MCQESLKRVPTRPNGLQDDVGSRCAKGFAAGDAGVQGAMPPAGVLGSAPKAIPLSLHPSINTRGRGRFARQ